MEDLYYRGTKFSFEQGDAQNQPNLEYILAECHEEDFLFQIICLSGYGSGLICGYVKNSSSLLDSGHKAITKANLIDEINRNFQKVILPSIRVCETVN